MRRLLLRVGLPFGLAALVAGLLLFEPWRAFTSSRLDEPVPVAAPATTEPSETTTTPPVPAVLAEGAFVSQEHDTSGTARVLELPNGSRVLRLEAFSTSDGPDVHVWLSDATAGGDWNAYDDGRYVPLGEIKATDGNHNYAIPADAELAGLRSVVIWCDRFNVAFGSAPLAL
ncbi:DM13 domain-containing protein [Actinophytocola oryzae]|uniref:Electron transfer DM13 n=1 Tax=Actinophytocola oryzae TaxID=502181 RepID=A0A4R7VMU0_9PSEU|nr:DM13 domain-containing protein [Actinophytocola oryzae]TDV50940.1 electron transfer DM13 [Actinophytocola oryzae]